MQRVLKRHDDVKITILVPVDERFFSINVQKKSIEQNNFTTFYHESDAEASL